MCFAIHAGGRTSGILWNTGWILIHKGLSWRNGVGSSDCFGCVNLKNKKYHIFNEPYSPEEYHKKIREFQIDSFAGIEDVKQRTHDFWARYPQKYMHENH